MNGLVLVACMYVYMYDYMCLNESKEGIHIEIPYLALPGYEKVKQHEDQHDKEH